MPRKKSGTFDNKVYQNEYHKAMKTKLLSFNPSSADDMMLWEHLQTKENVTAYIKNLIRGDIQPQPTHKGCLKVGGEAVSYWCYNCDGEVSETDSICPHCGKKFL